MDFFTVLKPGSSKSRCWQSWFLPEASRENPFHSSLLAFGGSWQSLAWGCKAAVFVFTWLPPLYLLYFKLNKFYFYTNNKEYYNKKNTCTCEIYIVSERVHRGKRMKTKVANNAS